MPVPNNKDMRFVITSVYMTSLEKIDFLPAVGPQSPQSLAFFSKLTLDEPDDLRLLAEDGSLHSFCWMLGLDVQSQTMSEGVTPSLSRVWESFSLLM